MTLLLPLLWLAATPPELAPVEAQFTRTPGLRAQFVQQRRWAALKDVLESSGTVAFERNGKLVWKTEKPSPTELVLDGAKATLKAGKLGVSQTFDLASDPGMAAVFESLTALVKADFATLEKQFQLKVTRASPVEVDLVPRAEGLAKVVSTIHLAFDKGHRLQSVELFEAAGDRTQIRFTGHAALDGGALP